MNEILRKNRTRVAITAVLLMGICSVLVGVETKNKPGRVSASGTTNVQDEEITQLHKTLNSALKKFAEGDRKEEYTFQLDLGRNNRITDASPSVFLEQATLKLSGGQVSYIEFWYTQTDENTLIVRDRKIINENVTSNDLSNLVLVSSSSEASTKRVRLQDVEKPEDKIKIILMYRDYLKKLIRALEYTVQKRSSNQTKDINEVLRLGTSR